MSFKSRRELMAWAKNWLVAKNDPFWQLELKMGEYAAMSSQYFLHDSTSPPYPSTKNEKNQLGRDT